MSGGKTASGTAFSRDGDLFYILNARRERIQLVCLGTEVALEIGKQQTGKAASFLPQAGPPPVAFRETASGLLHVVYREIVIRFAHAASQKRRRDILKDGGFEVRRVNPFVPSQVVVHDPRSKHSGEDLVEISNRWMQLEEVVFAAPSFVSQFLRQTPPSIRSEEWHLRNLGGGGAKAGEDIDVAAAWKKTTGDPRIVVAVLDDGIDVQHPNLARTIWKNPDTRSPDQIGRDFFVPADHPEHFDPRPKRFTFPYHLMAGNDVHGTPCAGLIAAAGRDGGAVGVAPRCRILPVKIFHADDLAAGERVANAIRYAAVHADILSCSWTSGINPDIELALEDAGHLGRQGRGAAVFCAAGNGGGDLVSFPARDPNAIAVGAVTDQGKRASYSNIGPQIAFVAPSSGGVQDIFTTDVSLENRGLNLGRKEQGGEDGLHTNRFGGTSAATSIAAGVAALVLSVHPSLSRSELKDLLARTADRIGSDLGGQGHRPELGFGRINAGKAVAEAETLAALSKRSRR